MKTFLFRVMPWLWLVLFGAEIVVVLLPSPEKEFHTAAFGRLPVLMKGRVQPFDSVARNSLLQIRSTGDVPLEMVPSWQFWRHPRKLKSTEWLLEVLFRPEVADTRPVFLIHHPELISELRLGETRWEKSGLRYYSWTELQPALTTIAEQGQQANQTPGAQRTAYQRQVLKLANAMSLYQQLKNSLQPEGTQDFAGLVAEFQAAVPAGLAAAHALQAGKEFDTESLRKLAGLVQQFESLARLALPLAVPPPEGAPPDAWTNVGMSLLSSLRDGMIHPSVSYYAQMATTFGRGDEAGFNAAVAAYGDWLKTRFAREVAKGRAEYYFNQVKFFLHATIIYLVAFALAAGALLTVDWSAGVSDSLRRSAFYLIGLAFAVHTIGLVYRMALEGRPPATNLYATAVFIGWGACAFGLVLERISRLGLGSAVAGLAGFITLLIAHNLALGGDTMEMLRAVLDTNFWLATHVITITLGYSAAFVAGGLAIAYILLGVFTPLLVLSAGQTTLGRALASMVYAVICFAMLFSVVGTVLGGIWADQSWGRFWGWDPKENGALLIVLWYAIILHARRAGLVRERGLMMLAIGGNIVTAFSWFGVNMLGIGLHSYGFMDAAFKWLMLFGASQLFVIALGLVPRTWWRSSCEAGV